MRYCKYNTAKVDRMASPTDFKLRPSPPSPKASARIPDHPKQFSAADDEQVYRRRVLVPPIPRAYCSSRLCPQGPGARRYQWSFEERCVLPRGLLQRIQWCVYFDSARKDAHDLVCRANVEDFMLCKAENRNPEHCLKEGRRVTRCATDLYVAMQLYVVLFILT